MVIRFQLETADLILEGMCLGSQLLTGGGRLLAGGGVGLDNAGDLLHAGADLAHGLVLTLGRFGNVLHFRENRYSFVVI